MTGLVLELQRDALNHEIKVSNLLRKALVISKKLGINQNEKWINNELKGYPVDDEVPSYRVVYGQILFKDVGYQCYFNMMNLKSYFQKEELIFLL